MSILRSSGACLFALVVLYIAMAIPASAQRFKSLAYSLTPPVGWTMSSQVPKGGVAFLGPREDYFTVNINVLSEPAPHQTLAQYMKSIHSQIASGKKMIILKEGSRVLAGTPAHTMLTDLNLRDRHELPTLRVHQIYALHKDRAYIITLTHPENISDVSANRYMNAFDKVVASFQWEH